MGIVETCKALTNPAFSFSVCLDSLHDVLKIGLDSAGGPSEDVKGKFYDDISFNLMGSPSPNHLLDHIAKVKPANDDVISIQYQFITVALMIWSFGLDDIKVGIGFSF